MFAAAKLPSVTRLLLQMVTGTLAGHGEVLGAAVVEGAMLVVGAAVVAAQRVHKVSRHVVTCCGDLSAEI